MIERKFVGSMSGGDGGDGPPRPDDYRILELKKHAFFEKQRVFLVHFEKRSKKKVHFEKRSKKKVHFVSFSF